MPVYFVTGKLGSGKSLACIDKIRTYLNQGRRVATNLDVRLEHLINPWAKNSVVYRLPDRPSLRDLESIGLGYDGPMRSDDFNGALVLDECALWFNARSWSDKDRQPIIDFLVHIRKRRWDVFFLVQDISVVDKQARDSFSEHVVYCRRTDRYNVPFLGPIFRFAWGDKLPMPRMHIGIVKYGDTHTSPIVDRWFYRGEDLYSAYDSEQKFKPFNPLDDSVALHSVLPPYYTYGRYITPKERFRNAVKNYAIKSRHFFLTGAVTAALATNLAVTAMPDMPRKGVFSCNSAYRELYGSCDAPAVLAPNHPYWQHQAASTVDSGPSSDALPQDKDPKPASSSSDGSSADPLDGVYITGSLKSDHGFDYTFADAVYSSDADTQFQRL